MLIFDGLFYKHIDFQFRPCKNAITYCQKYTSMPLFIQTGCNHKIGLFQVSCFAFPLILYKEEFDLCQECREETFKR